MLSAWPAVKGTSYRLSWFTFVSTHTASKSFACKSGRSLQNVLFFISFHEHAAHHMFCSHTHTHTHTQKKKHQRQNQQHTNQTKQQQKTLTADISRYPSIQALSPLILFQRQQTNTSLFDQTGASSRFELQSTARLRLTGANAREVASCTVFTKPQCAP